MLLHVFFQYFMNKAICEKVAKNLFISKKSTNFAARLTKWQTNYGYSTNQITLRNHR